MIRKMLNKLIKSKPTATAQKFNLIVAGYGGQGVITLTELICQLAIARGLQVKEAELHGLAQRGGSVQAHIRFGQNIFSPKVARADADLIIALDLLEAARTCWWASPTKTNILTDSQLYWPYDSQISGDQIISEVQPFAKKLELVDAAKTAQKISGNPVAANTYLLAAAVVFGFLPFAKNEVWKTISENLNPAYLADNQKVFEAAGNLGRQKGRG